MALPNPVVWLPEGVSGRRMLCAVSMAVDRWGHMGMHSQVAGAGSPAQLLAATVLRRPRVPFPLFFSSWSSDYCLYESELCVREL